MYGSLYHHVTFLLDEDLSKVLITMSDLVSSALKRILWSAQMAIPALALSWNHCAQKIIG